MPINWITEGLPAYFAPGSGEEERIDPFVDDPSNEVGPSRRRKRFTRARRRWPNISRQVQTRTQIEAIETFYDTTTDGGTLSFEFPRARLVASDDSTVTVTVRFIAGTFRIEDVSADIWQVSFGIEEI